jgi:glycosyltransferase involved in cell wall biosynthesis
MKKIVILSAFLTPFRSGAEACAEEVPLALSNEFNFTIVTTKLRSDLPREDVLQGKIPVVRVGIGLPIDKWLFPFLAPFAVRRLKPDIVHAVLETFAGLALVFCRYITLAKRILTCQTTRMFLKGMIVRSADIVTVISTALKTIVGALGRKNVLVIPNGIHTAMFHEKQKVDGRILFVGRLEKMKGVDVLLTAFAQLRITNNELRIVGDGSQRGALEELTQELGITDRVTFVGRVAPRNIASEYEQAQIFCGLSRSEALGNVFLEAQAAGCAVIATNVGGIPDIVKNGETGLLVAPNNPEAAAAALSRLLTDKTLLLSLSEAGKAHAKAYDWASIAEHYKTLYQVL